MFSPTHRFGDVLVVIDGPRRLRWSGPQDGSATPVELWPDATQRQDIEHHLHRKAPLLAIVDHDRGPVPLFAEEITTATAELAPLIWDEGDIAALDIPLLDWLPAPLRARGEAFLDRARAQRAATPRPLLPDLIVEDHADSPARIALRTSARPLAEHELAVTAEHLFGPQALTSSTTAALGGPLTTGHPA
ncbi:hypothetical protein AB0M68_19650 [Streptomyces sp. NPDC051453]|uniref:hypothetical protein n=1 Tax=Streptomyces sp. NPDC051453 TaxID=3154941 RepID=UPI00343FA362